MGLLDLFFGSLRRRTADAIRLGFMDGVKAVLGESAPAASEADMAENEIRLLLLPAPAEEPEAKANTKRKSG